MLAGPCAAAFAALEASELLASQAPGEAHHEGHSHHRGQTHTHDHSHTPGSSHHPVTVDDGCCYGVKVSPSADRSSPTPDEPIGVHFAGVPLPHLQIVGALRAMLSAPERCLLHQTSPPVYLATQRFRI